MVRGQVFIFIIVLLFANSLQAVLPETANETTRLLHTLDWERIGSEFLRDNPELNGEWRQTDTWEAWPCNGNYSYKVSVAAQVHAINFDPFMDTVRVDGVLSNVYFHADGNYKSVATSCVPLSGWVGAGARKIELSADLYIDSGATIEEVQVRVRRTSFSNLDLGAFVPDWFAQLFEDCINDATESLWSSRLGKWISAKLTDELHKQKPTP